MIISRLTVKTKIDNNFTAIKIKEIIKKESEIWKNNVVNKIKLDISGNKLKVRTGNLRNKIDGKVTQTSNKTKIEIGTRKVVYAKIHDDKKKTSITTKTKRWLTVPVDQTVKGRARQYSNKFVILSKKGNLLLVQKTGKGKRAKLRPLFILKKFITIEGVGYITNNVMNMKIFLEQSLRLNLNNMEIKTKKA